MKLAPFGIIGKEIIRDPWKAAENYLKLRGKYEEVVGDELFKEMEKAKIKKKFFHDFMVALCKIQIKNSFSEDKIITKLVDSLETLKRIENYLFESLIEFYGLYNPEKVYKIDLESFLKIKDLRNRDEHSMGYDLKEKDLETIEELFKLLEEIRKKENYIEDEIKNKMEKFAPNISKVATPILGAKLIYLAGSLEKLSEMPSSTIQLLGAEKALFRHLRTGAKPPKYGILLFHPLMNKTKKKGRLARILASKIAIAARVDFYGKEFVGDKLLKEVEEKI